MHADENWLENERNHIQGRKNDLNMLLLRSTNSMSAMIIVVTICCKFLCFEVLPAAAAALVPYAYMPNIFA